MASTSSEPKTHPHECVLCDKKFQCGDYGCEDDKAGTCKECYDPEEDEK